MRTIIQSTTISILLVFACVLFGASTGKAFTTYLILDPSQYQSCGGPPGYDCENDPWVVVSAGSTLDVIMYFDTDGEADIALLSVSVLFNDSTLQWDPGLSTSPTYALYDSAGKLNQYLVPAMTNLTLRNGTSDQILFDWQNNILPGGNRDACGISSFDPVPTCGFHMAVLEFNVIESFYALRGGGDVFTLSNSSPGNILQLSDGSNPENHLRIVPQPTTALLFGLGLVGLSMSQRRGSGSRSGRGRERRRAALARLLPLLLGGLLLLSVPPSVAKAESLTYQVTGVIYDVTDPLDALGGVVSLGMAFSGTIQYETGSSPINTSSSSAQFDWDPVGSALSISISVGSITASTDPSGRATMGVTNNASGYDRFGGVAFSIFSTGANITALDFAFRDSTTSAWDDVSIPTELDLADFDYTYVGILASGSGGPGVALGQIDTLTLIPEPSTALLLGMGLTGMAAVRRGRKPR